VTAIVDAGDFSERGGTLTALVDHGHFVEWPRDDAVLAAGLAAVVWRGHHPVFSSIRTWEWRVLLPSGVSVEGSASTKSGAMFAARSVARAQGFELAGGIRLWEWQRRLSSAYLSGVSTGVDGGPEPVRAATLEAKACRRGWARGRLERDRRGSILTARNGLRVLS